MRFAVLIALTISTLANANWGIGLNPAVSCNIPMRPGAGAINPADSIQMAHSQWRHRTNIHEGLQRHVTALATQIENDKVLIRGVLSDAAMAVVEEHFRSERGHSSYDYDCGRHPPGQPPPLGTSSAPVWRFPTEPGGGPAAGGGQVVVPHVFCSRGPDGRPVFESWHYYARDGGLVSETICESFLPGVNRPDANSTTKQMRCREGLRNYYARMANLKRMEAELERSRAEAQQAYDVHARVSAQTEGGYCATCQDPGVSYGQSIYGSTVSVFNPLQFFLNSILMQPQSFPPHGAHLPPRMSVNGGFYPTHAPPAHTRGYYGMHQGYYGALPSGVGAGAFACPSIHQGMHRHLGGRPRSMPMHVDPHMHALMAGGALVPGAGPGWGYPQVPQLQPYQMAQQQSGQWQGPRGQLPSRYAAPLGFNGPQASQIFSGPGFGPGANFYPNYDAGAALNWQLNQSGHQLNYINNGLYGGTGFETHYGWGTGYGFGYGNGRGGNYSPNYGYGSYGNYGNYGVNGYYFNGGAGYFARPPVLQYPQQPYNGYAPRPAAPPTAPYIK